MILSLLLWMLLSSAAAFVMISNKTPPPTVVTPMLRRSSRRQRTAFTITARPPKRSRSSSSNGAVVTPLPVVVSSIIPTPVSSSSSSTTSLLFSSVSGDDGTTTPSSPTFRRLPDIPTSGGGGDSFPQPNDNNGWHDLNIAPRELRPSAVLTTGQCFHWTALLSPSPNTTKSSAWGTHNAHQWMGTIRQWNNNDQQQQQEDYVLMIQETPETVFYKVLYPLDNTDPKAVHDMLGDYFQMYDQDNSQTTTTTPLLALDDLYVSWSKACPRLAQIAPCLPGVRILQQDPWECLVSFICSSNNNIPRIHQMLQQFRRTYGEPLLDVSEYIMQPQQDKDSASDSGSNSNWLYSFPSLERLRSLNVTEEDLRKTCGWGYRAKYLLATMETLQSLGGEAYLHRLRDNNNNESRVQEQLLQFTGVGPKVADCVALFSLRQHDAIPVDTHVWNMARRDYGLLRDGTTKTLTKSVYQDIGQLFRDRFGPYCGWAHSLLFAAELPSFRAALPEDLVEEMDQFRLEEKEQKKNEKNKQKEKKAATPTKRKSKRT